MWRGYHRDMANTEVAVVVALVCHESPVCYAWVAIPNKLNCLSHDATI